MRSAILVALLLAGCVTPTATEPDVELPAPVFRGGEVDITLASNGVLYAGGLHGDGFTAAAWSSADGGLTWRELAPPFGDMPADDAASLARSEDGLLVAVTLEQASGGTRPGPCTVAAASGDEGASWGEPVRICTASLTDRPWAVAYDGEVYMIWRTWGSTHELGHTSDGKTWYRSQVPAPPDGGGRLATDGVTLAYATNAPEGFRIVREDAPLFAWGIESVRSRPVHSMWPALSLGEEGAMIVAWATMRDSDAEDLVLAGEALKVDADIVAATKTAGAWQENVVDDEGLNLFPWTATRAGHLAVTWLHADDPDGDGLADDATEWRLRAWVDGEMREAPEPLLRGPAVRGSFGDYVGTALLEDGTVVALVPAPIEDAESGYFDAPLRAIRLPP